MISGPSGAGKGTLVSAALEALPSLSLSISATTRSPRQGDIEGKTYYFITDEQFDNLIEERGLLEWAEVHGFRYGTLVDQVNNTLEAGRDLILELDFQGFEQIKNYRDDVFSIFIVTPSMDVLRRRLERRGTDNLESIEERLIAAELEMQAKDSYNVVIVNDNLEKAKQELIHVISQQIRQ